MVKHNSVTYYLAPCPLTGTDWEIKLCVYKDSVMMICYGSETNYLIKGQFLTSYFQYPVAELVAKSEAAPAKDLGSVCYNWTFKLLHDQNFAAMVLGGSQPSQQSSLCEL